MGLDLAFIGVDLLLVHVVGADGAKLGFSVTLALPPEGARQYYWTAGRYMTAGVPSTSCSISLRETPCLSHFGELRSSPSNRAIFKFNFYTFVNTTVVLGVPSRSPAWLALVPLDCVF